jgi:23S rRNA (pseudouridine1915-N3)-methyltransferase
MKTELILVGKTVNKHFIAGINDYAERISHYMPFSITTIPELKNTKSLSEEQQKKAESFLLLRQLQPYDQVVLLDENGKQFTSVDFSETLEKQMAAGAKRLVFIIGGPYGFAQEVYERANSKMSLSPMTFSHQMVRLIFVEQLYRAFTILKGEPYHHQ